MGLLYILLKGSIFLDILKCGQQNQSLKAHFMAGNIFDWIFWQPGVKG